MDFYDLTLRARDKDGFPLLGGALPVIGHTPYLYRGAREVYRRAEERLGPFFWVNNGFGRHTLFCTHPDAFVAFRNKVTTSNHYSDVAGALLGDSLFVHDGPKHQHLRSAMNGPFTPKGLSAVEVGPVIAGTVDARVRSWLPCGDLTILTATRELALEVIFRMIGVPSRDVAEWRHHYEEYLLSALYMPVDIPGSPHWRARRAQRWLDTRMLELIHAARRDPDAGGFIAELVRARDDAGEPLSDHDLTENLRLFALAGHETSATVMAWLVAELALAPAYWDRLCDEALAAGDLPRTPRDLRQFPFAEAVFREALRLHPPVMNSTRRVTGPLEILGRAVPLGAEFAICLDRISRQEALYAEPDRFMPERWLGRREPVTGVELVQFGGGPHFCLGYHVAWMEIVAFAVALARAFRPLGLRPTLPGGPPATVFLPIAHLDAKTQIRFARG